MWWKRILVTALTLLGVFCFVFLPFGWNLPISGTFFAAALILAIVYFVQNRTPVEAFVIALPVIFGIGTFLGNSTQFFRAIGWIKPGYGLAIDPPALALNQTAHARLIASFADGSSFNLDGYRCTWHFSRALPLPPPDGPCGIDITSSAAVFKAGDPEAMTLTVTVDATPPGASAPVKLTPSQPYTLTLYNIATPSVVISPTTLELGQTVPARVTFTEGVTPTGYSCSWTPRAQFRPSPDSCETSFVAPETTGPYPDGKVPIQVTVVTHGLSLVSDKFTVTLHLPPPRLYDFVLDATTNMAPVMGGISLFDRAKRDITSQIARFGIAGGWLSITAFGQDVPKVADDCERVGQIYPLAPMNPPAADAALNAAHMVGHEAPVAKAIDAAVKEYAALRPAYDGKYILPYFVVITASANGCQNMSLEQVIAEVATAFENNDLHWQYYGKTMFSAVLAIETPGNPKPTEAIYTGTYQNDRNRTILLVAQTGEQVSAAISAIVDLADGDRAVRLRGCTALGDFLRRQSDRRGLVLLGQQCAG